MNLAIRYHFVLLLGVAQAVAAAEPAHFREGTESHTAVSGYRGEIAQVDYAGFALHGIRWSEADNKPCELSLMQRHLDDGRNTSTAGVFEHCLSFTNIFTEHAGVDFQDNPRYYIRGLQVCTNKKNNHRMKGLRIFPAKVWRNEPRIDYLNVKSEDKMANCAKWHPAVYCPRGKVAFGLDIHYSPEPASDWITGLALRCKTVTWHY